ncbi:MAG: HpcH/HpaI aldolase/citrate lyase family protein [Trueperaceae bacterium]|nr:HpcH/HpaI aldolase/citrate lyase family protein [Trueperaceae bacterium]
MINLATNQFKKRLAEFKLQRGVWCTIPDVTVVEILASSGFDWMLIDTEHSPSSDFSTYHLLQVAAAFPISTLVRVSSLNPVEIKKLLDFGAQSIMIPNVQTVEEAKLAAASVTYPPAGIRGVAGITRATAYGEVSDYAQKARDEICLIVQIETVKAVENIEAIAQVEGIDAMFVGPADLAASMGYVGQVSHPEVQKLATSAIERIRKQGKAPGFLALDKAFVQKTIDAGASFVATDIDMAALKRGIEVYKSE